MSEFSLRHRLRAATAEGHAELDDTVASLRLDTAWGYGAFLTASAAALEPLEIALEDAGVRTWLPDWPRRVRRFALARDLGALGLTPPPRRPAATMSRSFGAGLLYTLEGSRLGARFLARQIRAAAPPPPLAYLGQEGGEDLWRTFLVWLEAESVGIRTDEAEAGARYGFRRFSEAFESGAALGARSGALNVRGGARGRI